MASDSEKIVIRRRLSSVVRSLPKTYLGKQFFALQKAKSLGLIVIHTKDGE